MAKVGEAKSNEQRRAVVAAIVDEGRGASEVVAAAAAGDLSGVGAFTIGRSTAAEWAKAEREARRSPHEQIAAVRDDSIKAVRGLLRDVRKAGEATPAQLKALKQLPGLLRELERDAKAAAAAAAVVDDQGAEPRNPGFLERLAQEHDEQPTTHASAPSEPAETPTTSIQASSDPTVHPWCRDCQAGRCDTHRTPAKVISAHALRPDGLPALTDEQRARVEQILRPTMHGADPETDPETDPLVRKWREANGIQSHAPEPPAAPMTAPVPAARPSRVVEHSSLTRAFPGHD